MVCLGFEPAGWQVQTKPRSYRTALDRQIHTQVGRQVDMLVGWQIDRQLDMKAFVMHSLRQKVFSLHLPTYANLPTYLLTAFSWDDIQLGDQKSTLSVRPTLLQKWPKKSTSLKVHVFITIFIVLNCTHCGQSKNSLQLQNTTQEC